MRAARCLFTLRPPLSDKFHDVREMNLHTGLDDRAALDYVRTTAYNLNAAPRVAECERSPRADSTRQRPPGIDAAGDLSQPQDAVCAA